MKKKPTVFIFNIRLTNFFTLMKAKLGHMRRDIVELVKFGIDAEKLDAAEALLTSFSEIPNDEELLGNQVSTTQQKDAAAAKVRLEIDSIMTRVENKFGSNSGTYRKFGITGTSTLDGGKLSYAGRRVHRVASELLTELAGEGLTAAILTSLKSDLDKYETALGMQEDAFSERDIATEDRATKANEIYLLVSKYCETGKKIWESINEAKYNDYLIYNTPTGQPETPEKNATSETDTKN